MACDPDVADPDGKNVTLVLLREVELPRVTFYIHSCLNGAHNANILGLKPYSNRITWEGTAFKTITCSIHRSEMQNCIMGNAENHDAKGNVTRELTNTFK